MTTKKKVAKKSKPAMKQKGSQVQPAQPPTTAGPVRPSPQQGAPQQGKTGGSHQSLPRLGVSTLIEDPEGRTEVANAKRLLVQYGQDFLFLVAENRWLFWTGTHWAIDEAMRIFQQAEQVSDGLWDDIYSLPQKTQERLWEKLVKFATSSNSQHGIKAMVTIAQSRRAAKRSMFDADTNLLNVENGTVNLTTGSLQSHRCDNDMTKVAPVEFMSGAKDPVLDKFLDEATGGDKDLKRYLQKAVGYALCGQACEEKFFFIYGPGGTGKSTFIEMLTGMLGDYAKTAAFKSFTKSKFDGGSAAGPSEHLARLAGARLVVTNEVSEGKQLAEDVVKSLTGRDKITARIPYAKASIEFRPIFALFMIANDAPHVSPVDDAMWRRIVRIPFMVQFKQPDPGVKTHLTTDPGARSAILAWAVEGALLYQQEGLQPPACVVSSTEQYRTEENSFISFIDDCCTVDISNPDLWTPTVEILKAIRLYREATGISLKLSERALAKRLQQLDLKQARGCHDNRRARGWQGIRVNSVPDKELDIPVSKRTRETVEATPGDAEEPDFSTDKTKH